MRFESPDTIEKAVELLNTCDGISRVLAGGTDVLVQLRLALVEPELVVDIKHIPGMRDITAENGGYRIGAAVAGAELGEHADLVALWPGVVEAMELVGSTQVQGRATLVGNLCNASPAADSVSAMVAANAVATIVGPMVNVSVQLLIFLLDQAKHPWRKVRLSPPSTCLRAQIIQATRICGLSHVPKWTSRFPLLALTLPLMAMG